MADTPGTILIVDDEPATIGPLCGHPVDKQLAETRDRSSRTEASS